MIDDHLEEWLNRNVEEWKGGPLGDPESVVYALRTDYDDPVPFAKKLEGLLAAPGAGLIQALIIGTWASEMYDCDSSDVVKALVAARMPSLKHLFLGEIVVEESEISWINQSDVSPLLAAYPNLETLAVRGGTGLEFSTLKHDRLKTLVVETGGLSGQTVRQILAGRLPALETLELWLGSDNYGGDSTVEDLTALQSKPFPALLSLGLCNAEYTDQLVTFVARTPLLDYLRVLDLSMGTLDDEGAQPILDDPRFARLERLDLSDNFLTEARCRELKARLPRADVAGQRDPQDYDGERYCSVSE